MRILIVEDEPGIADTLQYVLASAKLKAVAPDVEPIRTVRGTGYALNEDLPGEIRT